MYAFRKALERKEGVQEIKVPHDAKPVAFLNRGGEPTVYFTTCRQARDTGKQRVARMQLTAGEAGVADNSQYIGVCEFSGGQIMYHLWEVDYAG